ncbi:hypothetical protein OOK58_24980 [Streptomyces sp. NBC_01728]|uniref:hypothetical protein n=1 Tax=unclassified Streptomyces TaxID=2593676 RepID=UPI002259B52A|nr:MULTISPECIES: hypothetical protein [unclassified Streptomyces]MCX4455260.1 hypothetical protein [Streptomyces sp. NBC_01719]MCX4494620.1 hypothetical protein [Streptomyces sp. NBC_01728]
MDIPDWFAWIFLGLVLVQVLGLVPIIHRLRGLDSAVRFKARLDLLVAVGGLLLFGGGLLGLVVAESWFWISVPGYALMAVGYAIKGVQRLRARRPAA